MLSPKADGFIRDARKGASRVPPRIRYVIGALSFLALVYYLHDPRVYTSRVAKVKPATSRPGGEWHTFDTIMSFGDSWSATQFNPGGEQPNEQNPMGNPELPQDGKTHPPNYLHYLTTTYNHTFLRTYNIAQGAATVDRTVVPPHEFLNWTHTFREQVDDIWKLAYPLYDANAKWTQESTLFIVWFGVVDIALLIDRKNYDRENAAKMAESYHQGLVSLYEAGARHFLLMTAPPMYLSPSSHEDGHNPFLQRLLTRDFNGHLYAKRKEFIASHADATMYIFDTHGLMTKVIQDPTCTPMTQHLRNTTDNCWDYNPDAYADTPKPWDWFRPECYIPFDQYLWANHLHPTHVFHNATAAAIVADCMSPRRQNFCS